MISQKPCDLEKRDRVGPLNGTKWIHASFKGALTVRLHWSKSDTGSNMFVCVFYNTAAHSLDEFLRPTV